MIFECFIFNYKIIHLKKKFLRRRKWKNYFEDCFEAKEQDLFEFEKNILFVLYGGRNILNFTPNSKRDNFDKKYITNENNYFIDI